MKIMQKISKYKYVYIYKSYTSIEGVVPAVHSDTN